MAESGNAKVSGDGINAGQEERQMYSKPYDHFPMIMLQLKMEADARAAGPKKMDREIPHEPSEDEMGYLIPKNARKEPIQPEIPPKEKPVFDNSGYMDMSGVGNLQINDEAEQGNTHIGPFNDNKFNMPVYENTLSPTLATGGLPANNTKLKDEEIQALEYIVSQNSAARHSYNVTVIETESSIRNNLETTEDMYWLTLDESNRTVDLEQQQWNQNIKKTVLHWSIVMLNKLVIPILAQAQVGSKN